MKSLHPLTRVAIAAFFWQFGFGLYRSVYNNFLAGELGIGAGSLGLIEGIREVPGLLTMFLAAATVHIFESRLAALSMAVMALGLALYTVAGSLWDLVFFTLIFSTGFHLLYPVQGAIVLGLSREGEKGRGLGRIEGVGAAAMLTAMVLVSATSSFITYRSYFLIAGVVTCLGALAMLSLPASRRASIRRRLVLKAAYAPYYILTLLAGARRHMFLTFAVFNLVKVHHVPVGTVALLLAVGTGLSIYGRPLLGAMVDRFGERAVLVSCYAAVAAILVGYATISYLPVLYVLFCLDNLLRFEMVTTTYLDKIASPEDISPTLATGSTVNHITGIIVPVAGGVLWEALGPWATFGAGALIALASIAYCLQGLPRPAPRALGA